MLASVLLEREIQVIPMTINMNSDKMTYTLLNPFIVIEFGFFLNIEQF